MRREGQGLVRAPGRGAGAPGCLPAGWLCSYNVHWHLYNVHVPHSSAMGWRCFFQSPPFHFPCAPPPSHPLSCAPFQCHPPVLAPHTHSHSLRPHHTRLLQADVQGRKNEESRLQQELAKLQASTHADIERIRVESAEAYDRCGWPCTLLRTFQRALLWESIAASHGLPDRCMLRLAASRQWPGTARLLRVRGHRGRGSWHGIRGAAGAGPGLATADKCLRCQAPGRTQPGCCSRLRSALGRCGALCSRPTVRACGHAGRSGCCATCATRRRRRPRAPRSRCRSCR